MCDRCDIDGIKKETWATANLGILVVQVDCGRSGITVVRVKTKIKDEEGKRNRLRSW